jgi:hypothetical protein
VTLLVYIGRGSINVPADFVVCPPFRVNALACHWKIVFRRIALLVCVRQRSIGYVIWGWLPPASVFGSSTGNDGVDPLMSGKPPFTAGFRDCSLTPVLADLVMPAFKPGKTLPCLKLGSPGIGERDDFRV